MVAGCLTRSVRRGCGNLMIVRFRPDIPAGVAVKIGSPVSLKHRQIKAIAACRPGGIVTAAVHGYRAPRGQATLEQATCTIGLLGPQM